MCSYHKCPSWAYYSWTTWTSDDEKCWTWRRYPETYQHRCRTEAGKCKGTSGGYHRMVSWHEIPPKKVVGYPPRSLTASLSLKSYRNPIGKHSSNLAFFRGKLAVFNFRRVSWNWEIKSRHFFHAGWLKKPSGLACFQDNKDWKSQPKSGAQMSFGTSTCQLELLETLWPEAWFEEWSCFNSNNLVN